MLKLYFWAGVAAGLTVFSLPPWSLALLVWVALVPLLLSIQAASSTLAAARVGLLYGIIFFAVAGSWACAAIARTQELPFAFAMPIFAVFVIAHAVQFALFAAGAARLMRGWHGVWQGLAVAPLYVAIDWLFPEIFPWTLANTLADYPSLIQLVDVTGVWGVTWVIVFINHTVAVCWIRAQQGEGVARRQASVAAAVLTGMLLYGQYRIASFAAAEGAGAGGLRVWLVQADAPTGPYHPGEDDQHFSFYEQLTLREMRRSIQEGSGPPHLVLWPEMVVRARLPESELWDDRFLDLAAQIEVPLLFGGSYVSPQVATAMPELDPLAFNSVLLASSSGPLRHLYSKRLLLPLGETAPVSFWQPTGWYQPGAKPAVFALPEISAPHTSTRFAASICYEATHPGFFNALVGDGAEVLLNLSDDAWFGGSEPQLHLLAAKLRAVETRRWLLRASNTGLSAVVAPSGRMLGVASMHDRTVLRGVVEARHERTVYVGFGDWLPFLCAIVAVATLYGWPVRREP